MGHMGVRLTYPDIILQIRLFVNRFVQNLYQQKQRLIARCFCVLYTITYNRHRNRRILRGKQARPRILQP